MLTHMITLERALSRAVCVPSLRDMLDAQPLNLSSIALREPVEAVLLPAGTAKVR